MWIQPHYRGSAFGVIVLGSKVVMLRASLLNFS
jgi:hypothetical protein